MRKLLSLALGVSLGVAIFLCGKWYLYVTFGTNPHDAAGTSLNEAMPDPLNAWGCTRLRERFPEAYAPKGCTAEDGRSWRR